MRIKKKASILMISAAAVATVGVGAVSFAAWTGENDSIRASAAAGSAYLFGFTDVQGTDEKLALGTLVPYDQTTGIISGENIVSVALPEYSVIGNYTITVTYSDGSNAKNLDFYAFVGNQVTAVPDGWFDAADKGGWKQVSSRNAIFEFNDVTAPGATINKADSKTVYVSLMLVSSNPDHMNETADFDITLTTVTNNA